MRKLVMLDMAAVVALLILVPTAMAQELPTTGGQAELPTTGGPSLLLLPAAALLFSSGVVVGYAALRRR